VNNGTACILHLVRTRAGAGAELNAANSGIEHAQKWIFMETRRKTATTAAA